MLCADHTRCRDQPIAQAEPAAQRRPGPRGRLDIIDVRRGAEDALQPAAGSESPTRAEGMAGLRIVVVAVVLGLVVAGLVMAAWAASRSQMQRVEELTRLERDDRAHAIGRAVDEAAAALAAVTSGRAWQRAQAALAGVATRLDTDGGQIAVPRGSGRDPEEDERRASSVAADWRQASAGLDDVLAPLLASHAIDSLLVIRRADERVLHDGTGEAGGRVARGLVRGLRSATAGDPLQTAALSALDRPRAGVFLVAAAREDSPFALAAGVSFATLTEASTTRLTLVDEAGRVRSWQHGVHRALDEATARAYVRRAMATAGGVPGTDVSVAALQLAGVPMTLIVEPELAVVRGTWAAFAVPAAMLLVLAVLLLAWLLRQVARTGRNLQPATGDDMGDLTVALPAPAFASHVAGPAEDADGPAPAASAGSSGPQTASADDALRDVQRAWLSAGAIVDDLAGLALVVRRHAEQAAGAVRGTQRDADILLGKAATLGAALGGAAKRARLATVMEGQAGDGAVAAPPGGQEGDEDPASPAFASLRGLARLTSEQAEACTDLHERARQLRDASAQAADVLAALDGYGERLSEAMSRLREFMASHRDAS